MSSMWQQYFKNNHCILLITLAIFLSYIPILHWPFSWMQTFFHEISHGMAAIITGGSISKITLHFRGSGLCETYGGLHFIILLSGYMGAIIWGASIYAISLYTHPKISEFLLIFIIGAIAISLLLWARDMITIIIMLLMIMTIFFLFGYRNNMIGKYISQFIGIYILLDAIKSPLYLIDGRSFGDGAKLADITYIPEILWVGLWFIMGGYILYRLMGYSPNQAPVKKHSIDY